MDGERRRKLKKAATAAGACILAAFLFGWFLESPEPRKYPEREPVVFWHMWTTEWKVIVDDICTRFNESQDVYEVIPLSLPKGVADSKFLLAAAGGEPPDCMAEWHQVVPQFANSKLILPLDEIMTAEELATFRSQAYPIAQKISAFNGRPYCMPLALDVRACYYRLDHLHQAGLIPASAPARVATQAEFEELRAVLPQTLEELTEWGRKLNVFDSKGRLVRLGFIPQWFRMFASVFGGGFYDWENNELLISTPENLQALTFLAEQQKAIGFDRMERFLSSLTTSHGADWPFATGKRSVSIDGQWKVQQLHKFAPDIPYMTTPIPPPKSGGKKMAGWVHGNFMTFPKGAKNTAGAWAFTLFWTGQDNPERASEFYTRAGWLPPSPAIAETRRYRAYVREHPQFQTFIDILASPNIESTPPVPFQLQLYDLIKRADESAMRGSLTPEQALRKLNDEVDEILNRRKEFGHEN
ncbi:extracellular solute-binding protein [Pontiella sulfatireligans]|uniref:sn-glycerol-3-phosphate-binding periplasmic protein UgpB n=1 Tax=Pontiella sulfatireligans TaxID=2750658 RepID=A0A6C2UPT7_9BACT|nr:extracellular solute-binding protein [Pontiella sulfatireligans]VGO21327.1 sn-glycerol-3-phosphate-binding periplasmic protein UgpB [Pontiella sulfatireligans]